MDPYWILHFLAFLAFWVREHFNAYKWAQKRILFPHGAWLPNNTKRKKHMFLVRPHFPKEPLNLSKYWYTHTHIYIYSILKLKEKPWPYDITTTGQHLWKLTPMKPEKKAQRHGKRTKNIYQTIILPILLNSGDFLDILKNLHLFTFAPNERIPNGRSVQLNGLKASMPYSRYVSHCSNLMWPPRRSSWWVTWAAVSLWTGHWNVWKFPSQRNQEDEQRLHFVFLQAKSKCENSHFSQVAQKTMQRMPLKNGKNDGTGRRFFSLWNGPNFRLQALVKLIYGESDRLKDVFPIERCVFFRSKTSSFCTLSSWANGHLYGRTWCKRDDRIPLWWVAGG